MRFRLVSRQDLPTLGQLVHPGFRMSGRVRENLVPLWTDLLLGADKTAVIEEPTLPIPHRIVGFGAAVFVTDAFVGRHLEDPQPYVSAIVYEEVLSGRSPVLSPSDIAVANASDGLNLLVLHFGLRDHDFSSEHSQLILRCGSAAFYFLYSGFHFNLVMQEVYGQQQAAYMEAGGFRCVGDFSVPPGDKTTYAERDCRPHLFALRREWVTMGAVNTLSFLFSPPRPHLGLSVVEQRVLLRALLNESDAAIGKAFGISLDAVKKTWRRIFERVAQSAPYVLSAEGSWASEHRGSEKRRYILDYLRAHPEELRPYKPVKAGRTSTKPAVGNG